MRGLPGSGKSTWARQLAKKYDAVICSADHFFEDEKGNYKWDETKLSQAHGLCYQKAERTLASGKSVIIDNTNIKRRLYKGYLYLADLFGAKVTLAEKRVPVEVCYKRGLHNVPLRQIEKMDKGWTEDFEFEKEPYEAGSV